MKPTYDELVAKVDEMRGLQRAYFSTRDLDVLRKSKAAEKAVDDMIERAKGKPTQGRMW